MVNPTPLRQRQTGFRLPLGEWFNDIIDRVNGLVAGTLTGSWAGTFTSSGHFLESVDNTYDIGANGANRPRNIYAGSNIYAVTNVGADLYTWGTTRSAMTSAVDGVITMANNAQTNSVSFTVGASNLLTLNGGLKTTGATFALQTATTLTDNAAAQVATMTNGPTAGNPTKWIAINDNGTTRYIPAW